MRDRRDKIECGLFSLDVFGDWVDDFIDDVHQQTDKIRLFKIDISMFVPCNTFQIGDTSFPHPQVLQELSLVFERYDCILMPITSKTLVWTRIAFSQLQGILRFPIVALAHDIQPIAFVDMAGKGFGDYIFEEDSCSMIRVRLLNVLERHRLLKENRGWAQSHPASPDVSKKILSFMANLMKEEKAKAAKRRRAAAKPSPEESVLYTKTFQEAKSSVISEFERKYVVEALRASHGNIAAAAQKSNKHRRAFWELVRKYGIDPDEFK